MSKPLFTQEHYNAIAHTLRDIDSEWVTEYAKFDVIEALVILFALDNPDFNEALFRVECWR